MLEQKYTDHLLFSILMGTRLSFCSQERHSFLFMISHGVSLSYKYEGYIDSRNVDTTLFSLYIQNLSLTSSL